MARAAKTAEFEMGCDIRAEAFAVRRAATARPGSAAKFRAILEANSALELLGRDDFLAAMHLKTARSFLKSA